MDARSYCGSPCAAARIWAGIWQPAMLTGIAQNMSVTIDFVCNMNRFRHLELFRFVRITKTLLGEDGKNRMPSQIPQRQIPYRSHPLDIDNSDQVMICSRIPTIKTVLPAITQSVQRCGCLSVPSNRVDLTINSFTNLRSITWATKSTTEKPEC